MAQKGPQETRTRAGVQGLTAREKAALTAIEDWYSRNPGKERTMDQKALTPLAKDAYSYGAEQGFRLGYFAAGEVVAEGIGTARWRFREQIMTRHRRHFEERRARGIADAVNRLNQE